MKALKRLIVNADDLGDTLSINRGVARGHVAGIVTSATLAVDAPAAADAPALVRDHPNLGVGLRVAAAAGAAPAEALAQARDQLKRFRALVGREPTHLDSHYRSRRLPAVLEALLTLAWETGLPVRNADPATGERLRREGIATTDQFVDGLPADALDALVRLLDGLDLGTTELGCHPALADGPAPPDVDDELGGRELLALMHRDARQAIQAAGIQLIHFGQL